MCKISATIRNSAGIHVRPSGLIIETINNYPGKIILHAKHMETVLKTAIDLLSLGLLQGDTVDIEVRGPHAQSMCARLKDLFETKFDFPPRK
jgi:phosphotransferase system HPr (HPr) family protein